MKYAISFFLSLSASAAPIQVFYEPETDRAQTVRQIFIGDYKIPEDLIAIKEVRHCEEIRAGGKLDLCLKNNGDLIVVSVDKSFVNESLKIFQAP